MKLSEIGEHGLIKRIAQRFPTLSKKIVCGIGDDCAVIDGEEEYELLTIDSQIENIHFLFHDISPEDLGYKALAVNLSDIASMGGIPRYALVSMALPVNLEVAWIDRFYDGMQKLASEYNVYIVGGNLAKSEGSIFIDICVQGMVQKDHLKTRTGAQVGDIVCVTGNLGDSRGALRLIQDK